MTGTILSKRSVVQRVFNSYIFRDWFQQEVHTQENCDGFGNAISNLKAAKHRFESLSTPLGRLVLYLPAFLNCLHRIATNRHGDAVAQDWHFYFGGCFSFVFFA